MCFLWGTNWNLCIIDKIRRTNGHCLGTFKIEGISSSPPPNIISLTTSSLSFSSVFKGLNRLSGRTVDISKQPMWLQVFVNHNSHWIGDSVRPRVGLNAMEKRTNLLPLPGIEGRFISSPGKEICVATFPLCLSISTWRRGGRAPTILHLGLHKHVVSSMLQAGTRPRYAFDKRLGGPHNPSRRCREKSLYMLWWSFGFDRRW
jgi:hypothetical protein